MHGRMRCGNSGQWRCMVGGAIGFERLISVASTCEMCALCCVAVGPGGRLWRRVRGVWVCVCVWLAVCAVWSAYCAPAVCVVTASAFVYRVWRGVETRSSLKTRPYPV